MQTGFCAGIGRGGGLLVVQSFLWVTHWEVLSGSPGDQTQRGGLAGDTRVRYLTVTARSLPGVDNLHRPRGAS